MSEALRTLTVPASSVTAMNCPHCFQHVPDGSAFCPYCGARISDPHPGALPEAAADPTYGALAHANLLRLRGDWNAAREKTVAVLREYPNSGTAHSLMGDIFADQEMYEDAAQWYRMALDLEPDNVADQRKLSTVEARLEEAALPREDETQNAPAALSGFRVAAWAAGAFLALVIVLGLWLRDSSPTPQPASTSRATPRATDRATNLVPTPQSPASSGRESPAVPPSQPPVTETPAGAVPPAETDAPDGGTAFGQTQPETTLRARLDALNPALERVGLRLADLQLDPRSQTATVTLDGSGVNGADPGWMLAVYQAALPVAATVFHGDAALHRARVRVVMPLAVPEGVSRELAFVGEVARPAGFDAAPGAALAGFSRRWWHPGLTPPPEIATTP